LSLAGDSELTALLAPLKDDIRLVFLNASFSHEQAQGLVTSIDCSIGMKGAITDEGAAAFSSSFYRAIAYGVSIQQAFEQGRTQLLLEGLPEEDIPHLLVREGVDPNRIVPIPKEKIPDLLVKEDIDPDQIVLIKHPANPS